MKSEPLTAVTDVDPWEIPSEDEMAILELREQEAADRDFVPIVDVPAKAKGSDKFLVPLPADIAEVFKPGATDLFIQAVRDKCGEFEPDISTPKGRAEIKSFAYAIKRTKTYADDAGKAFVEDIKTQAKVVDAERKRMRDALDLMEEEVRRPLTDYENAEKARVAAHEAAIQAMTLITATLRDQPAITSKDVIDSIAELDRFGSRDWQEFETRANKVRENVRVNLNRMLNEVIKAEQQHEELLRLRAEAEELKRLQREEQIRKEAEERVKREAEEQARQAAEAVERQARLEREKIEREKQAAQAEIDRRERLQREAEERAEQAERDKQEAIAKAERDRQEAAERAERNKKAAIESERKRFADLAAKEKAKQAAEAKRKADEDARRLADQKQRTAVEAKVIAGMKDCGISEELARGLIAAINAGRVPAVTIQY